MLFLKTINIYFGIQLIFVKIVIMPKTKQSKKGRGQKRNNDPLVKKPGALAEQDGRPKPYNIHRNGYL